MSAGIINVDVNPGGILDAIFKGIDSLVTTDAEKMALKNAASQAAIDGRLKEFAINAGLLQGQIEVNKIEAASDSPFKSNWRPAAGWVGVSALFFATTVPYAVRTGVWLWQCIATGQVLDPPELDLETVLLLLGQLLGFAGVRSFDKLKGTAA